VARDVTEAIKVPRAVFVPFPMGHHFGAPFHTELQRNIVVQALQLLHSAEVSGTILSLPLKWAQARREAKVLTDQGKRL
jgi:hypothetical protein